MLGRGGEQIATEKLSQAFYGHLGFSEWKSTVAGSWGLAVDISSIL